MQDAAAELTQEVRRSERLKNKKLNVPEPKVKSSDQTGEKGQKKQKQVGDDGSSSSSSSEKSGISSPFNDLPPEVKLYSCKTLYYEFCSYYIFYHLYHYYYSFLFLNYCYSSRFP